MTPEERAQTVYRLRSINEALELVRGHVRKMALLVMTEEPHVIAAELREARRAMEEIRSAMAVASVLPAPEQRPPVEHGDEVRY